VRYWWVNQNQTFRQEIDGGYLWSPKRNANGAKNPFYEFMREVAPGDLIFSFVDTRIVVIGTAASFCEESPRPTEFGGVGLNWGKIGWSVRVNFANRRMQSPWWGGFFFPVNTRRCAGGGARPAEKGIMSTGGSGWQKRKKSEK
jgi:hypothetical protein